MAVRCRPTLTIEAAERASAWYQARAAQDGASSPYRFPLAWAYYLNEQWEAAQALFEELANEFPGNVNYQGYLGVLAARRGDRNKAQQISERLEGLADPYDFGRDTYWQACIASLLGEQDRAMVLLRDAYAQGREFTLGLHLDMDLEPLHGYPPFEDFLRPKG